MKAYKGFNSDMTCRGFQYKEGGKFKTDSVSVCHFGFHACEHPLDCLGYYAPGDGSVYHEVELGGKIDKDSEDSKVAATEIKIGARLSIAGLVKAAIDYTMSKVKPEAKADEDNGAASATGDKGAASATGDNGAASAGHETAIAVAWGIEGRAKGVKGSHIVLADWRFLSDGWKFHGAKMLRIDDEAFKADTWYSFRNGEIVEV